jgi:hypothetical protein
MAAELNVPVWLRGGWAMDFFLGQVTRDHADIDWFARAADAGRPLVAGGPWAGRPWPEGMLDGSVGQIGRLRCPVIGPAAQIEIKRMMPVRVPGRPRRPRDDRDIERLEAALGR